MVTFLTIPGHAFADCDPWGNAYPPECADLSGVNVRVIEVGNLPVQPETASRCGVWLQRPGGPIVYILKNCKEGRDETLRHELCHQRMFELYGDPRWHQ